MEDIPQPANTPYIVGETVRIYTAPDDPDNTHHNKVCEVIEVFEDELDQETGRDLDQYTYRLRDLDTGNTLPIDFRHSDLVSDE